MENNKREIRHRTRHSSFSYSHRMPQYKAHLFNNQNLTCSSYTAVHYSKFQRNLCYPNVDLNNKCRGTSANHTINFESPKTKIKQNISAKHLNVSKPNPQAQESRSGIASQFRGAMRKCPPVKTHVTSKLACYDPSYDPEPLPLVSKEKKTQSKTPMPRLTFHVRVIYSLICITNKTHHRDSVQYTSSVEGGKRRQQKTLSFYTQVLVRNKMNRVNNLRRLLLLT